MKKNVQNTSWKSHQLVHCIDIAAIENSDIVSPHLDLALVLFRVILADKVEQMHVCNQL